MGQWATWWRPPAEAALMPRPPFASAEAEADQLLLGGLQLLDLNRFNATSTEGAIAVQLKWHHDLAFLCTCTRSSNAPHQQHLLHHGLG